MRLEILAGRDIWLVSIKPQFLAGPILNRLQVSVFLAGRVSFTYAYDIFNNNRENIIKYDQIKRS
jgi:hypothetical protein